jgi:hypothetical protein
MERGTAVAMKEVISAKVTVAPNLAVAAKAHPPNPVVRLPKERAVRHPKEREGKVLKERAARVPKGVRAPKAAIVRIRILPMIAI